MFVLSWRIPRWMRIVRKTFHSVWHGHETLWIQDSQLPPKNKMLAFPWDTIPRQALHGWYTPNLVTNGSTLWIIECNIQGYHLLYATAIHTWPRYITANRSITANIYKGLLNRFTLEVGLERELLHWKLAICKREYFTFEVCIHRQIPFPHNHRC